MTIVPTLLVIDDDASMLAFVSDVAKSLEFRVVARRDVSAALSEAHVIKPDAAIVDLTYLEATTVLSALAATDPQCPVILMARNQSVDGAISALKAGALDYLAKPFDRERLRDVLVTVRKRVERRETLLRIDADVAKQFEFYGMVGRSPAMQELFDTIRRLAPHLRTVLITGETGTGKELVAKALHRLGPRRDRRLITLNCSAVVETLFESELFGHVRGAFTGANETKVGLFEHADTGTIFLDEVGELPMSVQAKLLRAVEIRRSAARRRARHAKRGCLRHRSDQPRPAVGSRRRPLPHRPLLSPRHSRALSRPAARSARRHSLPGCGVHPRVFRAREAPDHRHHCGRRTAAADRAVARQRAAAPPRDRARLPDDRRPHAERTRAAGGDVGWHGRRRARSRPNSSNCDGITAGRLGPPLGGAARPNPTRAHAGRRQQDRRRARARHQPPVALPLDRSTRHPIISVRVPVRTAPILVVCCKETLRI